MAKINNFQQPTGPVDPNQTLYGYFVDEKACIAFICLFAISCAVHVFQSFKYRIWWLAPTMGLCALGEVIGWGGRLWSAKEWSVLDAYLMQICCTILSPSFLAAGLFFILGAIINRLGTQYATLSPKVFSLIFIACDVISLVVQAIGGASASIALETGKGDPERGAKIMVGGIIFQIVVVTFYVITGVVFLFRWGYDKPVRRRVPLGSESATFGSSSRQSMDRNMKTMLVGMGLATLFLYIRSIYRTIELLNGWTGKIIRNQNLFNYLDALQIVLALFTLNIFNPGRLIFGKKNDDDDLLQGQTSTLPTEKGEDRSA